MSDKKIARTMVFHQLLYHPWPWRIESDWTWEVTASDGFVVAKTDRTTAQDIIALAEEIHESFQKLESQMYAR